jgi:hypothetical protein
MLRTAWRLCCPLLAAVLLVAGCDRSPDGSAEEPGAGRAGAEGASGAGEGEGRGASGARQVSPCEPAARSSRRDRVGVALDEWSVVPNPGQVGAGNVTFQARNRGEERHELVIVKAASPSGLPTRQDGSIDSSRLDKGALVGEIKALAPGRTCNVTFKLSAGSYVFACNRVEDGQAHYNQGMVNLFAVT